MITAVLIAEHLHSSDFRIASELQESSTDKFDDVVYVANNRKTKIQVKHSNVNKNITRSTFLNDSDKLKLTALCSSVQKLSNNTRFAIVTNRATNGMDECTSDASQDVFSFTCNSNTLKELQPKQLSVAQKRVVKRILLITSTPGASLDLRRPGNLEIELMRLVRVNLGIGYYPNNQVSERDVAGRLILLANFLRSEQPGVFQKRGEIHRLLRKPVIEELVALTEKNRRTVLVGQPGSGKSHICDDLAKEKLNRNSKMVVKHFCYLEPTDRYAQERIVTQAMYGNFLHQFESIAPEIVNEVKPRFAATKDTLEAVLKALSKEQKKVLLVVDGIDHINRVAAPNRLAENTVDNFVKELSELRLPNGCSMLIVSQPTSELRELTKNDATQVYQLPAWDDELVGSFVRKHNRQLPKGRQLSLNSGIIPALLEKTEGNPLYLTIILRDLLSVDRNFDPISYVEHLPKDLNSYYDHLLKSFREHDLPIIHTLALIDFGITSDELCEMFPGIQRDAVRNTLKKMQPILKPGETPTGIRIYHESFRRFIIARGNRPGSKGSNLYEHIISWLTSKEFYKSQRAYRYLVPYLIRSGQADRVYSLLDVGFVSGSLYYFHSTESISMNLKKISDFAVRRYRWDVYCRAVELSRALYTYIEERSDIAMKEYHLAVISVHGVDLFCERLLFDGHPVFEPEQGILLCQIAEHAGGFPPWSLYDVTGRSMKLDGDEKVGRYREIESAHFLRCIRQMSCNVAILLLERMIRSARPDESVQLQVELLLKQFDLVFGVSQHHTELVKLRIARKKKHGLFLEIASYLIRGGMNKEAARLSSKVLRDTDDQELIMRSIRSGGNAKTLPKNLDILKLTEHVMNLESIYDDQLPMFGEWYHAVQISCWQKAATLKKIALLLNGSVHGWYRAWVRYLFELSRIEASKIRNARREERLITELETLLRIADPFKGSPRAVDLYAVREFSRDSFRRTLTVAKEFPRFSKVLILLMEISNQTSAHLQGTYIGPLTGDVLNDLLEETYPKASDRNRKAIKAQLVSNTEKRIGASKFYESSAIECLRLSRISSLERDSNESAEALRMGCIYLAAYGFRKDITVYEIVDPIPQLGRSDSTFAVRALRNSFPLIETVPHVTDGKETNRSLVYWLHSIVDTDLKIALQAIVEIISNDPRIDWRIDEGLEYLCEQLLDSRIEVEIIADLYETISHLKSSNVNVPLGMSIVFSLLQSDRRLPAQSLYDHICKILYMKSKFDFVSDREIYATVLSFSKRNGLRIHKQYKEHFRAEAASNETPKHRALSEKKPVPSIAFSQYPIQEIATLLDKTDSNHLLHPRNARNLGVALAKSTHASMEAISEGVLRMMRRTHFNDTSILGMKTLRDTLVMKQQVDLAAFVSMLGFVYILGGGGWFALADSNHNEFGKDAFRLSRRVAQDTLAKELSHLFSSEGYFIGPVRHLIGLFISCSSPRIAKAIWEEASNIIHHRLPISDELANRLQSRTPTLDYDRRKSLETLVNELIVARRLVR